MVLLLRRPPGCARRSIPSGTAVTGAQPSQAEAAMLSPRLHNLLDQGHAPYTTLNHPRTITAHDTASIAHIEPVHFAKTVMIKADDRLAMVVMPSTYRADLYRLGLALGGAMVE